MFLIKFVFLNTVCTECWDGYLVLGDHWTLPVGTRHYWWASWPYWAVLLGHWAPLLGHWALLLGHWALLLGHYDPLLGSESYC